MTITSPPAQPSLDIATTSNQKPFLDHLDDLRTTLIKIAASIACASVIAWIFSPQILRLLQWPLARVLPQIQDSSLTSLLTTLSPGGAVTLSFKLAVIMGILTVSPLCIYFLIQFIIPALKSQERNYLVPILFWGSILFAIGIGFAYFLALPQTLKFMIQYSFFLGVQPSWTIENYASFCLFFILAFGFAFEFPLIILSLVKLHILKAQSLSEKRRHAVLLIFIIAAVLTPPDALSQIMLALPLLVLYEICILIAKKMHR